MVLLLPARCAACSIPAAVAAVEKPPPGDPSDGSTLPVPASDGPPSSVGYIWPSAATSPLTSASLGQQLPQRQRHRRFQRIRGTHSRCGVGHRPRRRLGRLGPRLSHQDQHDDGAMTVYGHLSEIWVAPANTLARASPSERWVARATQQVAPASALDRGWARRSLGYLP
jgi:hypothetical protein